LSPWYLCVDPPLPHLSACPHQHHYASHDLHVLPSSHLHSGTSDTNDNFDTEVVYVICAMNSSVFLGHAIYCMQSSCSLRVLPSLLGTLCLAALQAWCLQSLLLVASFDYSPCVIVSFLICCYVHWNVAYFMNHLTRKEVILACSKVFTSCPKLC
ncbi:unnamed protein product, partial [Heligmosomoides polygyrus]|uniref:Vesicle transport protein n=1 Tax=Heligmosomoides polygyrus TaxID=6339 RepID=A0A183GDE4_HELPZ